MSRFIEGEARIQATLFPEVLDEYITEENPVRVIDVFIDGVDLANMGLGCFHTTSVASCPPILIDERQKTARNGRCPHQL